MPETTDNSRPYSVRTFSELLLALVRDYLRHFEPGAPGEVNVIRLEASGPSLALMFDQRGQEAPSLLIELRDIGDGAPLAELHHPDDADRGVFLRRG